MHSYRLAAGIFATRRKKRMGSERRGCQKLPTLMETKTNVPLRVIIYNTKQPRYLLKSRARYPHPLSSAFPLDCFPTTWTTPATSPSAPYTGMHSIEGAEPPTPARTFTASPLRAASDTAPRWSSSILRSCGVKRRRFSQSSVGR